MTHLSIWLRLWSRSYSSWVWAPDRALCWQVRAWSLPGVLCLPLSLSKIKKNIKKKIFIVNICCHSSNLSTFVLSIVKNIITEGSSNACNFLFVVVVVVAHTGESQDPVLTGTRPRPLSCWLVASSSSVQAAFQNYFIRISRGGSRHRYASEAARIILMSSPG